MKEFINRFLASTKEHVFRLYLHYLSAGFLSVITICVLGKWFGLLDLTQVIRVAGSGMTFLVIFFAGFQFKANHDWNRRHAAILAAKEMRNSIYEDMDLIDKTFGFSNRRKHEKLSVNEIHKKICIVDEQGELVREKNGKLSLNHKNEGANIARAIKNYLGAFEYLAAGIRQGVFDEDLIYTLYGGPIIRAASIFTDYIKHINTDMYPGRRGRIYCNLLNIQRKFENKEKDKTDAERPSPG
jgi:hypothetical protein